ncbi:MAG: hypothetical protein AB7S70_01185 [Hyphomicrobium sp.]|uniref:hypothetical protein n=1 Tax=Hyphomicrobium sp. TaxID=82 RepID=UPI003D0E2052
MSLDAFDRDVLIATAGSLLMAAGVAMLRQRWLLRGQGGVAFLIAGWLVVLAAFVAEGRIWGAELGTAYALGALSLAAYGVIAATFERREAKERSPREVALDPEERPTNWKRGTGKALLAIVLAGVAAIGVGVAFAVQAPLPPQDRAVLGGLLVPILWGGGMAWTLCDPRLVRATIILVTVSALGYGIAFLPKVLS